MDNVKVVKLRTGEELLCRLVGEGDDGSLDIDQALITGFQPDPQTGKISIGAVPFCPCAAFPITLTKDAYLFVTDATDKAEEMHRKSHSLVLTAPQGVAVP